MSDEAREEALQQKLAHDEKAKKTQETRQKQEDARVEVRARRQQNGRTGMKFVSALSCQKLPVLRDIAWSLELPEDGKKDQLIARIKAYFDRDENSVLRNNNQFAEIFATHGSKRRAAVLTQENTRNDNDNAEPGPSQRQFAEPLTNALSTPAPWQYNPLPYAGSAQWPAPYGTPYGMPYIPQSSFTVCEQPVSTTAHEESHTPVPALTYPQYSFSHVPYGPPYTQS
ncbi:hypothetical protein BKA93DRAFT_824714 [Sparassis latifolia]